MKLNVFPINIEFDQYTLSREPFSLDRLAELRRLHNHTHSFFRNGDYIYISNKDGDDQTIIGNPVSINTFSQPEITSSLIKHIFFRTFKDRFPTKIPVDFYPFTFFSEQIKDDIIYQFLPQSLQSLVGYKKVIELQLRLIQANKPIFGFVINVRRNWVFLKTCEQLVLEGFPLKNLDVVHSEVLPGLKNVLAPNEEFVGVVQDVVGEKAKIETNKGIVEFPLSELFLRKTRFNIATYLSYATSTRKSEEILRVIDSKKTEMLNPKRLYGEILKISESLFAAKDEHGVKRAILFENKDGFSYSVDYSPIDVSNTIELKTPTFIFDPAAVKTESSNPDKGLSNFGPYDSINFDTKSPHFLCVCHKDNRGAFATFLAELKDGIPTSKYFKKGLLKKYDLKNITYTIIELPAYDFGEYIKAIRDYSGNKPDGAIIEIPGEWKEIRGDGNPYYKIKAKLLSLEIPVQYITYDKVRGSNEYILNSVALQIYAKLGGTPWVLPSSRSVDREIIIGVGHSWSRQNQFSGSANTRVVGITTFLSSDGQYLLSDKARDVLYEKYFDELLRSLKNSIQKLEKEQGWNNGDTIRLIFHIFKPIKNVEFEVVSKLVTEIKNYKIQFAFVTISKSHPYVLFDTQQPGLPKYGGNGMKGEYIPNRASNVFLDSNTCIVQMFGARELKTDLHGMSNPIQIRVRVPQGSFDSGPIDHLLFSDLTYIVQQIYSFTYLSWRSFLPAEQPATMLYSALMSKLLSRLRKVDGWDPDSLNYKLKRKKWFL